MDASAERATDEEAHDGVDYHTAFASLFADLDECAAAPMEASLGEPPLLPRRRKQPDPPSAAQPFLATAGAASAAIGDEPVASSDGVALASSGMPTTSAAPSVSTEQPVGKEPKAARERKRRGELKSKYVAQIASFLPLVIFILASVPDGND